MGWAAFGEFCSTFDSGVNCKTEKAANGARTQQSRDALMSLYGALEFRNKVKQRGTIRLRR